MSETRTLILGAIAGFTILLGLPLGRLRRPVPGLRHMLNSIAIGILLFLLWDVLAAAFDPVDVALGKLHEHHGGLGPVIGYGTLFFAGIGAGLIGLVYYERFLTRRPIAVPVPVGVAAGVARPASTAESSADSTAEPRLARVEAARRLAMLIAIGIGLHNFGEGLAIGGSAARGDISLATLLVVGFALHNATEGFGIVAPLAAESERPSWSFLLTMGTIAGAPTLIGTIVGRQFTSDAVSVVFLTLAAGSILYVIIQLLAIAQKMGGRELLMWGVFLGLSAGFLTDMIVTAAGV